MRAGSLRRAASRRGSSDCVGRLRRAAARRAQQTACRPDTGSCSWSGVTGDRARPGSNFLAISAGEGKGGWFPAPQPRIVGGGATPGAGGLFRIFERSFQGCSIQTDDSSELLQIGGVDKSKLTRSDLHQPGAVTNRSCYKSKLLQIETLRVQIFTKRFCKFRFVTTSICNKSKLTI